MQHVGPLSLAVFWFSLIFILKKWDFDVRLTMSDHVSRGKSRYVYVPSTLITITVFVLSLLLWLLPNLDAHTSAYMALYIAYTSELATTIVPRRGKAIIIHDGLAVLAAAGLLLVLVSLALESMVSGSLLALLWGSITSMTVLGSFALDRTRERYLLIQGAYFFIFSITIVILTYFV